MSHKDFTFSIKNSLKTTHPYNIETAFPAYFLARQKKEQLSLHKFLTSFDDDKEETGSSSLNLCPFLKCICLLRKSMNLVQ